MLVTTLSVVNTFLIGVLIVFLYIFKRSVRPTIQEALNTVGAQISKTFGEPQVKRAMSVLGKQSGEVRADKALRKKAAGAVIDRMPALGMVLKQIGISPLEGVKLLNDPVFGPLIRRGLATAQGALEKVTSNFGGAGSSQGSGSLKEW